MLKPTIEEHRAQITATSCRWCGFEKLNEQPIQTEDHEGGWPLFGHSQPKWLWINCPGCKYEWALWKLGVGRKWHELRGGEKNE